LMALRMRRSKFISEFSSYQKNEEDEIMVIMEDIINNAA